MATTVRENIDVGSCAVLWTQDGGTETDLGFTAEGVEIQTSGTDYSVRADGITADIKRVNTETEITGDIELIEHTLDNIAVGWRSTKTTVTGTPAKESVDISPIAGMEVPFGKLVFHPRHLASSDKTKDVTIWMAMLQLNSSGEAFMATREARVGFSFYAGAKQDSATGKWFPLMTKGDSSTAVLFDFPPAP